ncbi:MAG: prepilin peptidase [Marinosulfonomonas sp.]
MARQVGFVSRKLANRRVGQVTSAAKTTFEPILGPSNPAGLSRAEFRVCLSLTVFPPADLFARFAVAGIVFAIGFTGFFFRLLGGGDVKILTVLMLFVPLPTLAVFGNVFSASLVLGVSFVMTARRVPALAHVPFKSLSPNAGFPMGISIAMAGLVHPLVVTLLLG